MCMPMSCVRGRWLVWIIGQRVTCVTPVARYLEELSAHVDFLTHLTGQQVFGAQLLADRLDARAQRVLRAVEGRDFELGRTRIFLRRGVWQGLPAGAEAKIAGSRGLEEAVARSLLGTSRL